VKHQQSSAAKHHPHLRTLRLPRHCDQLALWTPLARRRRPDRPSPVRHELVTTSLACRDSPRPRPRPVDGVPVYGPWPQVAAGHVRVQRVDVVAR
jgi:hypothetical protein